MSRHSLSRIGAIAGVIAALLACTTSTSTGSGRCEVDLTLSPTRGRPGDEITATGGPFTGNAYDQLVRIGGTTATVTGSARVDCDLCDTCRSDASCTACGRCPECDSVCDECTSNVTFIVPDVPAGPTTVRVVDGYGASAPAAFTVRRRGNDTAILP
jgi:hypothetical protein